MTYSFIKADAGSELWIPNAFTPNGDGINNMFTVSSLGITELEAYIYNRWGQLIFTWNTINGGWNGTYKGEPVKEDVYIYLIKAKGRDQTNYNKTGYITLLR